MYERDIIVSQKSMEKFLLDSLLEWGQGGRKASGQAAVLQNRACNWEILSLSPHHSHLSCQFYVWRRASLIGETHIMPMGSLLKYSGSTWIMCSSLEKPEKDQGRNIICSSLANEIDEALSAHC